MNWEARKRLEINDACRENFLKYTREAFKSIPVMEKPMILDLGCGTGVPTLEMARLTDGKITAVDTDRDRLEWLEEKIGRLKLQDRISVVRKSALRIDFPEKSFDIILAEGFFNIIGFEKGLSRFVTFLKSTGHFMIHDDYRYNTRKLQVIKKYNLQLIVSFQLDETVWWNEYCSCLQKKIAEFEKKWGKRVNADRLFKQEKSELVMYRKKPESWRSVYLVLKKLANES